MKFLSLLLVVALVAGCSTTRVNIDARSNSSSAGTAVTSGSAGLQVQGGSNSLAAALIAMALLAGAIEYARDPQPLPSPSSLLPENSPRAPGLAPERKVSEQDCSKPVDWSLGNLRCK